MRLLNLPWNRRASQDSVNRAPASVTPPASPLDSLGRELVASQAPRPSPPATAAPRPSAPATVSAEAPGYRRDRRRLAAFGGRVLQWDTTLEKHKPAPVSYAQLNLPFPVIECTDKKRGSIAYTMTGSRLRGSYGKIKLGVAADGGGVCIKEIRLALTDGTRKPGVDRDGLPKTQAVRPDEATIEVEATRCMRGIIQAHIDAGILCNNGVDPLAMLRTRLTPFVVHPPFVVADKLHMVTSLESGDLCDVQEGLPKHLRGALAWSVGAQISDELSAVYEAGFVHLDIKPENLLLSRYGQFKLADWMTADSFERSGLTTPTRGVTGTHPAPDMLRLPTHRRQDGSWQPHKLTPDVDTWQLAVTLLRFLVPDAIASPFLWQAHLVRRNDITMMREHIETFESWRVAAFDIHGTFRVQALEASNVFARYFKEAHTHNPELCIYLLRHVLRLDSRSRVTATAMAHWFHDAVLALPAETFTPLLEHFDAVHIRSNQDLDLQHLRAFRTRVVSPKP